MQLEFRLANVGENAVKSCVLASGRQASLSSNGFFSRELKLEIAALRAAMLQGGADLDDLRSLFVRLLESVLAWQSAAESVLESAGIDIQTSRDR